MRLNASAAESQPGDIFERAAPAIHSMPASKNMIAIEWKPDTHENGAMKMARKAPVKAKSKPGIVISVRNGLQHIISYADC